MPLRIRRATPDDLEGVCRVHVDAVRTFCQKHYTAEEIEDWVGRLRPGAHAADIAAEEFFVATDESGEVCGLGILAAEQDEILAIYTHPRAVRRGVGRALIEKLETVALERGTPRLQLNASLNAVAFYIAAGYEPERATRHRLRSGREVRCCFMTKDLVPNGAAAPVQRDMAVYLVPYDPMWAARFEEERGAILAALGDRALAVEHVGSTAVPGMAAKPILDVAVVVEDILMAPALFTPLEALGYEYFPYAEEAHPERRWFYKPDRLNRTHHLYLLELGSPLLRDTLLFRDTLRARPDEARRYEELKRELAAHFPLDREAYTEGKGAFVRAALAAARR